MPLPIRVISTLQTTHTGAAHGNDLAPPVTPSRGVLRRQSTAMDWSLSSVPTLQPVNHGLNGYEVALPVGAKWITEGEWSGTYESGGQHYITQNQQSYGVIRRAGEDGLRLRPTAAKRYQPLVRRNEQGDWAVHLESGVQSGPSSGPEALLQRSHGLSPQQARDLLAGFEFHPEHKASSEQAVAQSLATTGQIPAWAHRYWKGPQPFSVPPREALFLGAGYEHLTPDMPRGGLASDTVGGHGQGSDLAPESPSAHSPIVDVPSPLGQSVPIDVPSPPGQSAAIDVPSPPGHGAIIDVQGPHAHQAIKIGDELHEILPASVDATTVFLKPRESAWLNEPAGYEDFTYQIIVGHQPLPATRQADGSWRVGAPLFDEPIDRTLSRVFPTLAPHAINQLARYVYFLGAPVLPLTGAGIRGVHKVLEGLKTRKVIDVPEPHDLLGRLSLVSTKQLSNTALWQNGGQIERLEFRFSPAQQELVDIFWRANVSSDLSISDRTRAGMLWSLEHRSTLDPLQQVFTNDLTFAEHLSDIGVQIMRKSGYEMLHIDKPLVKKTGPDTPWFVFRRADTGEVFVMRVTADKRKLPTLTEPQRKSIELSMPSNVRVLIERARHEGKLSWLVGGVYDPPLNRVPSATRSFSVFRAF